MGGWAGHFRAPESFLMLGGLAYPIEEQRRARAAGGDRSSVPEGAGRGEQASVGKAAFLSKPHTSNRQFRSSSGLLPGRPTGKGGRPPGTMGAPSPAETTPGSLS